MHRTAITNTRLVNLLKAGRGQGAGNQYRPWIQVTRQDHASHGQSHILPNPFLGRQHHLLSDLERSVCVLNMAQPVIVDIREQFPLWPYSHPTPAQEMLGTQNDLTLDSLPESPGSLALAKQLKIRHAKFVGLHVPFIYTTDQVLTVKLPGHRTFLVALSIKYWSDLRGDLNTEKTKEQRVRARKALFRKLRLEREYWKSLGICWLLVTDRMIQEQVYLNLEWALSGVIQGVTDNDVFLVKQFVSAWNATKWDGRLIDQLKAIGVVFKINTDTVIRLMKIALMRGLIPVDHTRTVHLQLPFPHGENASPLSIPGWSVLKHVRGLA